ncbi:hypothetical protein MWU58_04135 [Flavobacteriaceae bacterium S0825]|uniref:hypothetical protein n=1 Tax=Gaetbulibacter sp. S0825 TaxID=2720084 RepID=UPI00143124FE|nr:hypothetical protein [Gaetbulibacter sp. S0825]MCK0108469.1 hypothetical protein [Flavobacteriaceae bacterium S0825]NIX64105.1 hypothetical protein [Gaetbulibacter sp. S0825]
MKQHCLILIFLLAIIGCKPAFDIKKETNNIEKTTKKDLLNKENYTKRVVSFYPKKYWKKRSKDSMLNAMDSLTKILNNPLNSNPDYFSNHNVVINKNSDVIKADNNYFVLISANETFDIKKGFDIIFINEIKNYLNNNLITTIEGENKILVNVNSDIIGVYNKKYDSWDYFNLNARMLLDAYEIKTTKKILEIYFRDVFIPPKTPFNDKDFQEFRNLYSEIEDYEQYQNLDFDDYCKCIYIYQDKLLEIDDDIPDEYYESKTYLDNIYKCRILTTIN